MSAARRRQSGTSASSLPAQEGNDIVLLCIGTNGKEIWKRKLGTGDKTWKRDEGSNNASPSPSTDGKHVWGLTGAGDFVCFDFDGKEIWRCNLQERYGTFKQNWGGIHTSPLLEGDRLYLSLLQANAALVVAIDKSTGAEVWKIQRQSDATGESKEAYTSPMIGTNGKEKYLITHGGDYTIAHRLSDGSEIGASATSIPRRSIAGIIVLLPPRPCSADLVVVPTAKKGVLVGVRPDAQGMVKTGSEYELWRKPGLTPDVPSPLIHDGLVYLDGEQGVLTCLEAKTGKQLYSERLHADVYRASPVLADGKLYCVSRDGTVTVVKAGPKFEILATNKMPAPIAASPAVSNGRIYLRGFDASCTPSAREGSRRRRCYH